MQGPLGPTVAEYIFERAKQVTLLTISKGPAALVTPVSTAPRATPTEHCMKKLIGNETSKHIKKTAYVKAVDERFNQQY